MKSMSFQLKVKINIVPVNNITGYVMEVNFSLKYAIQRFYLFFLFFSTRLHSLF